MSALFKCQNAAAGEIKLIISDIFKPMNELTFFFRLAGERKCFVFLCIYTFIFYRRSFRTKNRKIKNYEMM